MRNCSDIEFLQRFSLLLYVSLLRYSIEYGIGGELNIFFVPKLFMLMLGVGNLHLEVRYSACLSALTIAYRIIAQSGPFQRLRTYIFDTMALCTSCKFLFNYELATLMK